MRPPAVLVKSSVTDCLARRAGTHFNRARMRALVQGQWRRVRHCRCDLAGRVREEFFLCRYLIERFQTSGAAFAVTLSALIRMLYHTYQGPHGTLSILAFGLLIGWYYWRTRSLGAVVLTHALADLLALT
jgi:hypothetical protein